jgi:predicted transcriptional regulator
MTTQDPLELLEGHPFDHLVTADEKQRIEAHVAGLVGADAAIKDIRLAIGVAQTAVADAMGVSKSAVAQLEGRDIDSIQVGTLNRYFAALGYRLQFELEPIDA